MRSGRYALMAVLLVAFGLRLLLLGAANVWWDEAYSVWLARKPLADVLRITAHDVHPPLYYLLLHGWIRLAGDSEFAVRFPSAAAGALTVAAVYPLGVRLLGRRWAAFGALLLAISGFHVWWSQEARMYIAASGWATVALYLLVRQTSSQRSTWGWVGCALFVALGLYTLYLAALVVLAAGMTVLGLWAARKLRWEVVRRWGVSQLAAALIYLPWLLYALPRIRSQAAAADSSPATIVGLYMLLLSTGISTNVDHYLPLALGYGALVLAALVALAVRRSWRALTALAPAALVPPLVIYLLAVVPSRFYSPAPEARYFLLFAPVCALIPAAAAKELADWRGWTGAALAVSLVGLALWALPARYVNRYLRDEWKTAARILGAYADPDDVVVLVSGDRYPLFLYEYERLPPGRPPVRLVPDGIATLTSENVDEQMTRATSGGNRVWLVEIESGLQDPEGLARAWMDERLRVALSSDLDYNQLTLYTADGDPPHVSQGDIEPLTPAAEPVLGVDLPVREFRPGDTVHLGLYALPEKAEVQMVHASGLVLAERTVPVVAGTGVFRHDVVFPITQATPRGRYSVTSGGATLETLRVTHSDPLWMERQVPRPYPAGLGEAIELVGYGLTPDISRPGDTLSVDLYWRADGVVERSYTVFVQVVGPFNPASGNPLWGQHDGPPVGGDFPTNDWPAGMIVRDRHTLTFHPAAPPADYALLIGMYDPQTGERVPVTDHPDKALPLCRFSVP